MDWRKVPHLFANGKFKYLRTLNNEPERIIGVRDNRFFKFLDMTEEPIGKSKLIARRIDSLSDEELEEFKSVHSSELFGTLTEVMEVDGFSVDEFLYLLSIGVYPFEWNESVININQIDEG